jgi:hypothetical protein
MVSAEARVKLRSGEDEHAIVAGLCVDLIPGLHTIPISSRAFCGASLVFLHPWEMLAHLNMRQWR